MANDYNYDVIIFNALLREMRSPNNLSDIEYIAKVDANFVIGMPFYEIFVTFTNGAKVKVDLTTIQEPREEQSSIGARMVKNMINSVVNLTCEDE